MGIDRGSFENLEIESQVELVNKWLQDGQSLNNIGKSLGIWESTIRKKFNKEGYERKGKRFIKLDDKCDGVKGYKDIIKVDEPKAKVNNEVVKVDKIVTWDDFESVKSSIEQLQNEVIELKDNLYENQQSKGNAIVNECFEVRVFKEKAITRNYKFYPEMLSELYKLKEKYPQYTLQDMMNTLLMESLEKYLK